MTPGTGGPCSAHCRGGAEMRSMLVALACTLALAAPGARAAQDADRYRHLLEVQQAEPAPALKEGAGVTAEDITIDSKLLGKVMRARVLLPAGYRTSHRYYPAAY